MTDQAPVIETRNLARRFGRTDAVDGLTLRVAAGRCYGFFGRNGAGKTTTIKCLLNLLQPTGGEVRIFGLDPASDEVARSRGVLPVDVGARDARLRRLLPGTLEPGDRGDAAEAVPARPGAKDERAVERAAHAARAHHRHLRRAGPARARRAHLRTGSHRPPRVHPDRHRRVSGRRAWTPDGVRLDAPHLGVRGAHRRVHDHRPRTRGVDARSRRGSRAVSADPGALRDRARSAGLSAGTHAAPARCSASGSR